MKLDEASALQYMGGDMTLLKELLTYALELKDERWAEIQAAFDQKDFTCYEIKAHGLKGAMRYLGFNEVSSFCQMQEQACHKGDFQAVINNHAALKQLYDDAHLYITEYLSQQ